MKHHFDIIKGHSEQPMSLDGLQALVEEGSAVHRYLVAHLPSRMTQGLFGRYTLQFVQGPVAEGPA